MKKLLVAGVLAMFSGAAMAVPVTLIIGDEDGFGGAFPDLSIPQDHRSAGEQAATDGSEQTDFYSTLFTPLASSFTMSFTFSGVVNSLALDYRSYGLQALTFGVFGASANGINVSNLFNFNDGAFGDATHGGAFSAAVLTSINTSGVLNLTLSRNNSNDAVAFDYFRVRGDQTLSVPEPATLGLLGLGLLGLGLSRRRKSAA